MSGLRIRFQHGRVAFGLLTIDANVAGGHRRDTRVYEASCCIGRCTFGDLVNGGIANAAGKLKRLSRHDVSPLEQSDACSERRYKLPDCA